MPVETETTALNKKLNIGLFVDAFLPYIDGVVMVVDNYAKHLNNLGTVYVVCPAPTDKNYKHDKPYRILNCKSLNIPIVNVNYSRPKKDKEFLKKLDALDLDIIHVHTPFAMGALGVKTAQRKGIPLIATLHSQYKKDFKRFARLDFIVDKLLKRVMKVFNACDEVWTFNSACESTLYEYGYKGKCRLIPNATDMTPVPDIGEQIEKADAEYGLAGVENVFIFVGRLYKAKNNSFSLKALARLKERGFTNFKFLIVGAGENERKLRKLIKKLNLGGNVVFTGLVKDRAKLGGLLARSDLFLFPSLYDMSSLVQIEAACYKTPVLFLEGANTASAVIDGVNGFVGPNDLQAFANKIADVMKNRQKLKDAGERANKDLYITWDKLAEKIYGRYTELIYEKKK